jgi:hypothetical protein
MIRRYIKKWTYSYSRKVKNRNQKNPNKNHKIEKKTKQKLSYLFQGAIHKKRGWRLFCCQKN